MHGGVLAGVWIDLLLLHNESAGNTCKNDDDDLCIVLSCSLYCPVYLALLVLLADHLHRHHHHLLALPVRPEDLGDLRGHATSTAQHSRHVVQLRHKLVQHHKLAECLS
jgi:hypothetical protein